MSDLQHHVIMVKMRRTCVMMHEFLLPLSLEAEVQEERTLFDCEISRKKRTKMERKYNR